MTDRLGVLLMTYGSPADDLHDIAEYRRWHREAAVRGRLMPRFLNTLWVKLEQSRPLRPLPPRT